MLTFYCRSNSTYAEAQQQLAALTCKTKDKHNYLTVRTQGFSKNTEHYTLGCVHRRPGLLHVLYHCIMPRRLTHLLEVTSAKKIHLQTN
jgi:hypothetical protein